MTNTLPVVVATAPTTGYFLGNPSGCSGESQLYQCQISFYCISLYVAAFEPLLHRHDHSNQFWRDTGLNMSASLIERIRLSRSVTSLRRALGIRNPSATAVFSRIYQKNLWGDPESRSGRGSTLARTTTIRIELPALLERIGAHSLIDAACGDFNWMAQVNLGEIKYVGIDVVPDLIARNRELYGRDGRDFLIGDIARDQLPEADVILCRDCLIHQSLEDALAAIDNFRRSNSRYLLATTHPALQQNIDIATGSWRPLNLELPPFSFPAPIHLLTEDAELGKYLGLWELERL